MTKRVAVLLVFLSLACAPCVLAQDDSQGTSFSPDQLDNLLAPIALYPDPLLAQVLTASTFPDQIDEAARFVRANPDPSYIDSQPWDVSVKAVAHYPDVLYKMDGDLDWTTALGQAYVNQPEDVMASVQRLREEARSAGNLVTTPQWDVEDSGGNIEIWPAQAQYIYVPVYDPSIVYFGRGGVYGNVISFGAGFAIGAWLNCDFDWHGHRVYYTGWEHGGGWMARSRPFIQVNSVYVSNNYRNVVVNRNVVNVNVNYGGLNRYQSVHRQVNYGNVRPGRTAVVNNQNNPSRATVNWISGNNANINRNINVQDTRINDYRGRGPAPAPNPPIPARTQTIQPTYQAPAPQVQRQEHGAFSGNTGGFDEHAASQRGQASRTQQYQPAARPSSPPPSSGGRGGAAPADRGKR